MLRLFLVGAAGLAERRERPRGVWGPSPSALCAALVYASRWACWRSRLASADSSLALIGALRGGLSGCCPSRRRRELVFRGLRWRLGSSRISTCRFLQAQITRISLMGLLCA